MSFYHSGAERGRLTVCNAGKPYQSHPWRLTGPCHSRRRAARVASGRDALRPASRTDAVAPPACGRGAVAGRPHVPAPRRSPRMWARLFPGPTSPARLLSLPHTWARRHGALYRVLGTPLPRTSARPHGGCTATRSDEPSRGRERHDPERLGYRGYWLLSSLKRLDDRAVERRERRRGRGGRIRSPRRTRRGDTSHRVPT